MSDLGDWMLRIGLPVFVFQLTGSALTTATVFVVETVPAVLVGQVAGVLVDRVDRRRIIIVGTLLQAVLLLPLLAVRSADELWIVYLVAAGEAVLASICGPATLALVPSLVEPAQLASANALSAVSQNIARLVGSPVGGLAVAVGGLTAVVIVDALTFVAVAVLVAGITDHGRGPVGEREAKAAAAKARTRGRRRRPGGGMDRRAAHDHGLGPPAERPADRCREPGRAGDVHRPVRRVRAPAAVRRRLGASASSAASRRSAA